MFSRIFLIVSLLSIQVFANNSFSVKCVTSKHKKNSIELKLKADFDIGEEEYGLSSLLADVDIKMRIKAQFNGKDFDEHQIISKGQFIKTEADVAYDEKITGHNKKVKFEYLFIDDKKGSLNINIDGVTHGYEHLECIII